MANLVIIRSNRGGEGKTLLAQLFIEYLVEIQADWFAFFSAPREQPKRGSYPERISDLDIESTYEQVRFIDTVLRADDAWTLLDLSHVHNRSFMEFCDATNAIGELTEHHVESWSMRVYSLSLREIRATFWPESLVDAREILVVNNLNPVQLREWRQSDMRVELAESRIPEFSIPRVDETAVQLFLSQGNLLHDYLRDRSGSGKDVFARVQLAKLVQAFQPQLSQYLLSRDLGKLNDPLFH